MTRLTVATVTGRTPYLSVEAARRLQEQRQVGLDLAPVGVGPVLGLALQRGDLVLEGVVPPAGGPRDRHQDPAGHRHTELPPTDERV